MTLQIDFSKYKGLIFDMDGTLVDTMPKHLSAWQKCSLEFNFSFDYSWFYNLGGMPSKKIVLKINEEQNTKLSPDEVVAFKMQEYAKIKEEITTIDATINLVKEFYQKKPLAIGTGAPRYLANEILKNTNLKHYFNAVITADDVKNHKPNPDTFLLAAKKINIDPIDCLVFEDTYSGLTAAKSAKMDCVLITNHKLDKFFSAS